jgi:hypothetical protein
MEGVAPRMEERTPDVVDQLAASYYAPPGPHWYLASDSSQTLLESDVDPGAELTVVAAGLGFGEYL